MTLSEFILWFLFVVRGIRDSQSRNARTYILGATGVGTPFTRLARMRAPPGTPAAH